MRFSLKVKAAAAVTVLFLAMTALIAIVQTQFIRAGLLERVAEQQSRLVAGVATALDQRLQTNLLALTQEALAISPDVLAHPSAFRGYLEHQPAMLLLFDGLLIFSPAGEVLADAPQVAGRQGINVADREYFQRAIATRKPVISAPHVARAARRPTVTMIAPILDQDGRLAGFLGGTLDLLKPKLLGSLTATTVGKTGYFFAITKDQPSVYVVHPDPSLILKPSIEAGAIAANELALSGHEETTEADDGQGKPGLFSYQSLATTNWLLATNYPLAEALAPVVAAERRLWSISAILMTLLAPLVWFLTWYLILPLLRLHDDVQRLRRSNGAISPDLQDRQDEIGDLARDFNTLIAERQQGVEALRRSTQLLDNIVENIPVAIQLKAVNDDLRFIMWNKAAETMFGFPRERVIGRAVCENWSAEDIARYREADLLAVASTAQEFAHREIVTAHRGTIITHLRKVPLFDADGTPTHLLVILDDITERVAAEARLAQSEARFRGAAESALDAFFILDSVRDAAGEICDFRFRYLNANAERFISKPAEQVIGQLLCAIVPTQLSDGHFEKYASVVRTGIPLDEEFRANAEGLSATWLHHQVVRLEDGVAITTRDISARKAAEEELRSKQEELRAKTAELLTVSDASPLGMFRTDVKGRRTYANHSYELLAGLSAEEALADGWTQAIHVDDRERVVRQSEAAVRGQQPFASLHRYQHRDGRIVWASVRAAPVMVDGNVVGYVGSVDDITARREAEYALQASEHRLRTITDTMPAWIAYVDSQEIYRFTNAAFERAFDLTREQVRGRTIRAVVGEAGYMAIKPYLSLVFGGQSVTFEREQLVADGLRWVEATWVPEIDEDSNAVVGFHALLRDITAQKLEEQRLLRLSQIDSLTGLANRVGLEQRLSDAMAESRNTGEALAVMYLDIDHFKQINDAHGHAAGDALLLAFAQRLRSSLRKTDTVARLGGDEFVVVMERMLDPKIAARLAAQALKEIRRPFAFADRSASLSITASIGIAFFDGGPTVAAQLVAEADAMLYAAKRRGRNKVCSASWPRRSHAIGATLH